MKRGFNFSAYDKNIANVLARHILRAILTYPFDNAAYITTIT